MNARPVRTALKTALLVTTAFGLSIAPAWAQSTATPGTTQLDTISVAGQGTGTEDPHGPVNGFVATRSVTATKTDTPLIETPQSITVIGRDQLDTIKPQTVSEAVRYSAGVVGSPYGASSSYDYYLIRGFTASDTGLYKDGLQLLNYGFSSYQIEPFGLERIEVLRGPAAVLFGQGGPGGLVNLVTKRPPTEDLRYLEVGGGSFAQRYVAFDFGGASDSSGHWFYRLTGLGRQGGTQTDGVVDDRAYIAPSVTYKPDGATTFTLLTSFQSDKTGRIGSFLPYDGTVKPQALGLRIPRNYNIGDPGANQLDRTQAFAGYEFEHHFNDVWTFRQNLRYSYTESNDNSFGAGSGYLDAAQTEISRYRFLARSRARTFTFDNQAEARFNDGFFNHTLVMGLDYKHHQLNDNQATGFPIDPFNILTRNYYSRTAATAPYLVNYDVFSQLGLYAQDQIKLTDRLTLVVSGRGDFTTSTVNNRLTPASSTTQRADAFSQRYALIYNFDNGLAPYVSYSTFFNPLIGTNFFSQPFKPETGDQMEAGIKYKPPGYDLLFTMAGFQINRDNQLTADPTNVNNQVQIGQVRSTGVEAEIQANITPDLKLVGSFTKYDLEITKGAVDQIGLTPTAVPQMLASVFTDYTIPDGPLKGLGFGGGVRWVGSSYADTANTLRVPDYTLFDTVVHYTRDNWRLAVNATNIGDRKFVASCQSANSCFYGEERRVIASLSYRW